MEAFAAVSLVGNILQFVHSIRQLVTSTRDIISQGTTREFLELETVAQDLRDRSRRVLAPVHSTGAPSATLDPVIVSLGEDCDSIVQELLQVLQQVNSKGKQSRWESFYQALRSEWRQDEIESLCRRLDRISHALNARLMEHDQRKVLVGLDKLAEENGRLQISRNLEITELKAECQKLFEEIRSNGHRELSGPPALAKLQLMAGKGLKISAEQAILEELRFDRLGDRFTSVSIAHENTLSWIFGSTSEFQLHSTSSNFVQWLESRENLFWISGKPGSGKSTLMKFIYTHRKTHEHLKNWAEGHEVIYAEYFFWNASKSLLQKSQEGLLRSIIYQALRQCPETIPSTFPHFRHLFDVVDHGQCDEFQQSRLREDPTINDIESLLEAVRNMCASFSESGKRLCFFIDGLDEYHGRSSDIIKLIEVLRSLPQVKICVSSRPWNEFEQALGTESCRKLFTHDLNSKDISAYIYDNFSKDQNYQDLEDKDTQGEAFVQEIVEAAKGVFLWVILVVRSFKEGLQNGDSILSLQKRLRSLPSDLDEYFQRIIFHDVDVFYRLQSAHMFYITLEAFDNLPLISYWFMEEDDLPDRKPLTMQQTNKRLKDMKRRLNACCKGLLEPVYQTPAYDPSGQSSLPSSILFHWKVDFLHRTVRDYLRLSTTQALLESWASCDFRPHETICKILLSQLKTAPQGLEYGESLLGLCKLFYYHAEESREYIHLEFCPQIDSIVESYGGQIPHRRPDFTNVAANVQANWIQGSEKPKKLSTKSTIPSTKSTRKLGGGSSVQSADTERSFKEFLLKFRGKKLAFQ